MSTILEHTRTTLPPDASSAEKEAVTAAILAGSLEIELRGKTASAAYLRCPVCEQDEAVALPIATFRLHRLMEQFHARHVRCIVGRAVSREDGG